MIRFVILIEWLLLRLSAVTSPCFPSHINLYIYIYSTGKYSSEKEPHSLWRARHLFFAYDYLINHSHDGVIKWKHFPRYWPFVRGIHRSPVNSPHKGQWRGALMFSLICACTNGWANNREADESRRHCAHYDAIVMDSGHGLMASW